MSSSNEGVKCCITKFFIPRNNSYLWRDLFKNSFGKGSKKAQDESKGFYFITEKDILEQFLSRFFNKEWKSSFLIMIIERDLVDSQQTPNIMIIIIWKIYKYGVLEI